MNIPMLNLRAQYESMQSEIDEAIARCFKHQHWVLGPEVQSFEEQVKSYLGSQHCVGVASGTDALVIGLRALCLKKYGKEYFTRDAEIITTPFTFSATGEAILRAGATPVFIDIDPVTYNIDLTKLAVYLEQSENAVGIIPVHLFGQPCNMDRLMSLAKKHDCFVVEDVAQGFGSKWCEQKAGTIGDIGAYSFFPSKNLGGIGDGGLIATQNEELADYARIIAQHGGRDKYNIDYLGYNSRLDAIQAAVLSVKCRAIDAHNQSRRLLAKTYSKCLDGLDGLVVPAVDARAYHIYHQYTLSVRDRAGLFAHLSQRGVSSMVYYPFPLHKMKVFERYGFIAPEPLSNAEYMAEHVLSLPIDPLQTMEQTSLIIDSIRAFYTKSETHHNEEAWAAIA